MDRILIILKKENGPRASSAPALGLNTIIFKHVYWYMQQTQVSVYRTIGPLVIMTCGKNDILGSNVKHLAGVWTDNAKPWNFVLGPTKYERLKSTVARKCS